MNILGYFINPLSLNENKFREFLDQCDIKYIIVDYYTLPNYSQNYLNFQLFQIEDEESIMFITLKFITKPLTLDDRILKIVSNDD